MEITDYNMGFQKTEINQRAIDLVLWEFTQEDSTSPWKDLQRFHMGKLLIKLFLKL